MDIFLLSSHLSLYVNKTLDEIPAPEIAYEQLHDVADNIPPIDNKAIMMMLIGRDITLAHHKLDQKVLSDNLSYGKELHLGRNLLFVKWPSVSGAKL